MWAAHTTPHNTCRAQVSGNSTMSTGTSPPNDRIQHNDYNTGTVGPLRVYVQQTTNTATYTLMIPLISCESRMREKSGLVSVKLKKWCLHNERRRKKSSNSLTHAHTVCTTHLCQGDPAWAAARSEWRRGGPPYWPWPAVARNGGDGASAAHPSTCE